MGRTFLAILLALSWSTAVCAQETPTENTENAENVESTAELRTWTDSTGKFQIDARFVEYRNFEVTIETADGKSIKLPLKKLSQEDQEFVRAEIKARADARNPKPDKPMVPDPAQPDVAGPGDQPAPAKAEVNDRGLGILPLEKPRAFVHVEGMPAPKPEDCVRCRWTDPERDATDMVTAETERLKTFGERNMELEKKLDLDYTLVRVETHHLVLHAELTAAEALKVGQALEATKLHLQHVTGSMLLTPQRPGTHEMICVHGKEHYHKLIELLKEENPGVDENGDNFWDIAKELAGGTVGKTSYFYQDNASDPPAHMAISLFGINAMKQAASGRSPSWADVGFAAYCENVVLGAVKVHYIRYANKELNIGPDWRLECKKLALAGELQPWTRQMEMDLRDYELVDHVQAYAMIAYLLQRDPQKFQDMIQQFGQAVPGAEAIETAYGVKLDQIENEWFAWLAR